MVPQIFVCEGLDSLGKSTLIESIQDQLGPYPVIHCSKPKKIDLFEGDQKRYQQRFFHNIMSLIRNISPEHQLILDRSWLGENIYAPLYRGTSGDWVFDLEQLYTLDEVPNLRLILLLEDFSVSKHFVSDGKSFDDTKRREEQELFIRAFNRSIIPDKRAICVTDPDTGNFKPRERILEEALS